MKFLSIVSIHNSGSTALYQYLEQCANTRVLREGSLKEGSTVTHANPGGCRRLCTLDTKFASLDNYDLKTITTEWFRIWRLGGFISESTILVEKSAGAGIYMCNWTKELFDQAYFLVLVRNPYANIEGIRRREGHDIKLCAKQWTNAAKIQWGHLASLGNTILIRYEDMCDSKKQVECLIKSLIPELSDFNLNQLTTVHSIDGIQRRSLVNLNNRQIARLSKEDISQINSVLEPHNDILYCLGYEKIS